MARSWELNLFIARSRCRAYIGAQSMLSHRKARQASLLGSVASGGVTAIVGILAGTLVSMGCAARVDTGSSGAVGQGGGPDGAVVSSGGSGTAGGGAIAGGSGTGGGAGSAIAGSGGGLGTGGAGGGQTGGVGTGGRGSGHGGGTAAGGAAGTGGARGTGGAAGTGGVPGTGGGAGIGGARGTGGAMGAGGGPGTGGAVGTGGAKGTGGAGTGGATGTGGVGGFGGMANTGGMGAQGGGIGTTFTAVYAAIFGTATCAGTLCHNPGIQKGIDLSTQANAYNSLKFEVVPGDGAGSALYRLLSNGTMPPDPAPKLTANQVDAVRAWIDAGALDN
jgi:hypothetical protein